MLAGLVDALAEHALPVVVTNLRCERERASLCEGTRRHVLLRRGSESVAVLATISPSVLPGVAAETRAGLHLEDPLSAVRTATQSLRAAGATYVVLMAQGPRDQRGLEELDVLQRGLAAHGSAARMPDVILAGGLTDEEGNRALQVLRRQGTPPAVGSQTGASALTRVTLRRQTHGDGGQVEVSAEGVPVVHDKVVPEAEAWLVPEIARYCREYQRAVSPPPARGSLSHDEFLAYTLEIMRRQAGAEIALLNRAAVKTAPFPIAGPVTRAQLHRALPYKTIIGMARLTGPAVASLLGPALDNPKAAIVGLVRTAAGLEVNGRPLDKARNHRVATISFVASGGDDILDAAAIAWHPLPGSPDLREAIQAFLATETGRRDHDPRVDPYTDFGPLPGRRLLLVGLMDGGLDMADTRIDNGPGYGDPQVTRGKQRVWKAEWTGTLQARHPRHEADSRLNLKYGWTRSQPAGGAAASTETADLVTLSSVYNYRGLRAEPSLPRRRVPDPYVRVGVESELTRPALSPTQTRAFHHLELTNTVGVLFTVMPTLKIRGGAGVRKELLTDSPPFGR